MKPTTNLTPTKTRVIQKLNPNHNLKQFQSGTPELDRYIQQFARRDAEQKLASVYILVTENDLQTTLGFYTLYCSAIEPSSLPNHASRGMHPTKDMPIVMLGHLAAHQSAQRQGLGKMLLGNAIIVASEISEKVAAYALVLDALDEKVEQFYLQTGFAKLNNYQHRLFFQLK